MLVRTRSDGGAPFQNRQQSQVDGERVPPWATPRGRLFSFIITILYTFINRRHLQTPLRGNYKLQVDRISAQKPIPCNTFSSKNLRKFLIVNLVKTQVLKI